MRWLLALLVSWVACVPAAPDGPSGTGDVHPAGYAAPESHGLETKLQTLDCRTCHGTDLEGGTSGVACDTCHAPAEPTKWRSDCTFCHGGLDDASGAPPRHLDGTSDPARAKFPPHAAHVSATLTASVDCTQCHVKAVDVLGDGHVFDTTPGRAEVDFGASLSKAGVWDGSGTCSNLYCHGSGRADDGVVSMAAGKPDCQSCHPGVSSGSVGWAKMSGLHATHLASTTGGVTSCADCHAAVTADGATLVDPAKHVDGRRQVDFAAGGMGWNPAQATCTGSCHGHSHASSVWPGGAGTGGRYHPAGWASPQAHGPELALGRQDCRGCHGATLTGGPGAPSCDSCHRASWRTTCTYCHGGGVNQTGAPPRDLGAPISTVSQSFRAHTVHVTQRIAVAQDCASCHRKPIDALTAEHMFDATPGRAEVSLAASLSPQGTYDGAGSCANLYCHGNGRTNGTIRDGAAPRTCAGCHPAEGSAEAALGTMSGDHRRHIVIDDVGCADCHRQVTTNGTTIAAVALHLDGKRAVSFSAAGFAYDPVTRRCTGNCHGENHDETW